MENKYVLPQGRIFHVVEGGCCIAAMALLVVAKKETLQYDDNTYCTKSSDMEGLKNFLVRMGFKEK